MQLSLVRDFVNLSLGGSLRPFMVYLTEQAEVSEQEIDELKELVNGLENRRRNP